MSDDCDFVEGTGVLTTGGPEWCKTHNAPAWRCRYYYLRDRFKAVEEPIRKWMGSCTCNGCQEIRALLKDDADPVEQAMPCKICGVSGYHNSEVNHSPLEPDTWCALCGAQARLAPAISVYCPTKDCPNDTTEWVSTPPSADKVKP